jgi:hypothetical protein
MLYSLLSYQVIAKNFKIFSFKKEVMIIRNDPKKKPDLRNQAFISTQMNFYRSIQPTSIFVDV